MPETLTNLINNEQVPAASGALIDVVEPATGAVHARIPDSDASDIDAAVAAAKSAFPAWAQTPPAERSRLLLRLADLIERDLERLARAESIDSGKPIALARSVDIPRAAANFRFFATAILHTESAAHQSNLPGPGGAVQALNFTLRKPRGVAGLISPWNLPLYLLTWKIAPAIATGNTAVAKPSEVTPLTAFMLGELALEAGFPPGVLNIVHGRGATAGAPLVSHPDVPTVSFTGGTETGRAIAHAGADTFKRISLELGGKNPNLVFADADMDEAVATSVRAAFTNQGQICLCGSRLLVERSIHDEFVDRLVADAKARRLGDPLDESTEHGALVSEDHLAKVDSYVQLARELGGEIRCGGARAEAPNDRCANGAFYKPTVITGLDPACRPQQEEIFGPVVTVTPFDSDDDAIAIANSTPYGLASMVWTSDLSRAHRVADRIDSAIVWVNCWMLRDLRTPFGGMKHSGLGREGGKDALNFFTEPKNVCIKL
jgi:aminomuconate-semialdehyde/2-hydroxymuconate-6-semialdehyde dehydrogenase